MRDNGLPNTHPIRRGPKGERDTLRYYLRSTTGVTYRVTKGTPKGTLKVSTQSVTTTTSPYSSLYRRN